MKSDHIIECERQAKAVQSLMNDPALPVLRGVFDGYSTRLVEKAGFPAAFITGAGVSERNGLGGCRNHGTPREPRAKWACGCADVENSWLHQHSELLRLTDQ
jgi:hypothetical protein